MLKKLSSLLIGVLCTAIVSFGKINGRTVDWGIKATLNAELPTKWYGEHKSVRMFNNGIGFTIGVLTDISLGKNFYFEPNISLFMSQYRYDLIIQYNNTENPKLSKYGIEIPAVFGYNLKFNDKCILKIFTGPQIRYACTGKIGMKDNQQREEYEDLLLWSSNRRFDFSWKLGIGVPIKRFIISAETDFGITDLYKDSSLTGSTKWRYHENRIGIGIFYSF